MRRYSTAAVFILILVGIVLVGLKLGPRESHRGATQESAILAAQTVVGNAVKKRGGHHGPRQLDVVFLSGSDAITAAPSTGDPDLWIVSGTANAGTAKLHWAVTERWDGVREWRATSVEVVGPKQ